MDDDALDPKDKDLEEDFEEDFEDDLIVGKKKGKKTPTEDDSLDMLAEEEDEAMPEDSYDDEDLW